MKTVSGILLSFGLVLFLAGTSYSQVATTSNPSKSTTTQATAAPGKFVDANANGICDHHEAKCTQAQGKNFVDKNGDGKCDNCGSAGKCSGSGCGKGNWIGQGCGKSQGKGNCGQGQNSGQGCGQGHQHKNGCTMQGTQPATKPEK